MNNNLKAMAARVPGIKYAVRVRDTLKWAGLGLSGKGFIPGHYHSPIPDIHQVRSHESRIWPDLPRALPGINMNIKEQLSYLDEFTNYSPDLPYTTTSDIATRYSVDNAVYPLSDALILYSMMRKLRPQRIIEVGSGYSSCVMMDSNDMFFENKIQLTFIEPYPDRLISLMKKEDLDKYQLINSDLQNVDKDIFTSLRENDILFVDSTHVSKIDSDVNLIIFELLPLLNRGVYIHFHDVFYPFEYPKLWIYNLGYWWNENYLLRAFLQYNNDFKIVFFDSYLAHFYKDNFVKCLPAYFKDTSSGNSVHGSIWLKRV